MTFDKIPANTFQQLQMNAAMILSDFDVTTGTFNPDDQIGATSGGITFSAVPSFSDLGSDVDNCPKNMMELKMIETWTVTASGTYVTMNTAAAKSMLSAADISTSNTAFVNPRNDLLVTDFDDIWIVGDYSNKNTTSGGATAGYLAIRMENALSTGGFKIKTKEKAKGKFDFEYTAHYSMSNQDDVPFELYIKAGT